MQYGYGSFAGGLGKLLQDTFISALVCTIAKEREPPQRSLMCVTKAIFKPVMNTN